MEDRTRINIILDTLQKKYDQIAADEELQKYSYPKKQNYLDALGFAIEVIEDSEDIKKLQKKCEELFRDSRYGKHYIDKMEAMNVILRNKYVDHRFCDFNGCMLGLMRLEEHEVQ